ncbi:uncharacterized protein LOC124168075 isoform X2 [Ischnura elegans]|nr:uncharacterized protein LOC124168075 isoform X2 [Ischnura elegans]
MHAEDCDQVSQYDFSYFASKPVDLVGLKVAELTAWLNAGFWMLGFVTIFIRCICAADFELVHVSTSEPVPGLDASQAAAKVADLPDTDTTTVSEN